jgi:VWFA-related protein
LAVILLIAGAVVARPERLLSQAIQRSMYVSVLDQTGAPVQGLTPSDVIVREDNVSREVLRVTRAEDPMQIAILVDTSTNARDDISYIRDALPSFIATLTSGDAGARNQVALVGIGDRPTILADYTNDRATLQKGVDRVWSTRATGAYLVDAVLEVSQGFKKRDAKRPVMIAIVAEGPEASFRSYDQALTPLRNAGAAFHVVMLGTPFIGLTDEDRSRARVLDEGTRTTGGAREQLLTPLGLKTRLTQLADVLTHQYRVTYARPQTLIPPEHITVSAKNAQQTARGTVINDSQTRP